MEKNQERKDFDLLFRRFYAELLVYARSFVGDDAGDVVQEVFLQLWRQRNVVDMGQQIRSYLYRAVYTRSLNLLRHRHLSATRIQLIEEINDIRMACMADKERTGLQQLEVNDLRTIIDAAINGLPDKCQQVFRLNYIHEMTCREIADAMGISVRTVEAHLYKAIRILRQKLYNLPIVALLLNLVSNEIIQR